MRVEALTGKGPEAAVGSRWSPKDTETLTKLWAEYGTMEAAIEAIYASLENAHRRRSRAAIRARIVRAISDGEISSAPENRAQPLGDRRTSDDLEFPKRDPRPLKEIYAGRRYDQ